MFRLHGGSLKLYTETVGQNSAAVWCGENPMIYNGSFSHPKVVQDFVCINRVTTLLEDKGLLKTLGSADRHQTLQGSQPSSSYLNTWRTVERTIRANHENSSTCINWGCSGKVSHATHGREHNLKHLRLTKLSGSNMSQNQSSRCFFSRNSVT